MLTAAQFLIRVLASLAIPLAVGDIITTDGALSKPGVIEANPIARFIQKVLKRKWSLGRMALAMAGIWSAFQSDGSWLAVAILAASDALTTYAVINNYKLWHR